MSALLTFGHGEDGLVFSKDTGQATPIEQPKAVEEASPAEHQPRQG